MKEKKILEIIEKILEIRSGICDSQEILSSLTQQLYSLKEKNVNS